MSRSTGRRALILLAALGLLASTAAGPVGAADPAKAVKATPRFSTAVAFDVSPALASLEAVPASAGAAPDEIRDVRPDRGPQPADEGYTGDGALAGPSAKALAPAAATIGAPIANFEAISNQDNFNLFGFRVNPPDPMGDVGPNHYVEMVNLAWAVYDKAGTLLLGPPPASPAGRLASAASSSPAVGRGRKPRLTHRHRQPRSSAGAAVLAVESPAARGNSPGEVAQQAVIGTPDAAPWMTRLDLDDVELRQALGCVPLTVRDGVDMCGEACMMPSNAGGSRERSGGFHGTASQRSVARHVPEANGETDPRARR